MYTNVNKFRWKNKWCIFALLLANKTVAQNKKKIENVIKSVVNSANVSWIIFVQLLSAQLVEIHQLIVDHQRLISLSVLDDLLCRWKWILGQNWWKSVFKHQPISLHLRQFFFLCISSLINDLLLVGQHFFSYLYFFRRK